MAAVPLYGRYDWFTTTGAGRKEFIAFLQRLVVKKKFATHRQVYLDASPITRVRADAPPFFVLHGTDDSIIPVTEGREFVEALRAVSTARWPTPRCRTPSTPSTSTAPRAHTSPPRPSSGSCPGCRQVIHNAKTNRARWKTRTI